MINKRLKLVSNYVEYRRLADIGSDHAYLPIYLAQEGKIDFAVAGEIVEGPHKVSVANVLENKLENIIFCRQASGLDAINLADNIEVITICGMGGKLIADILERGKDKLVNKPQLILQPNVGEDVLREKLEELGYNIVAENIIKEDEHIYEILVAKEGKMKLNSLEKKFGKYLMEKNSDTFKEKWSRELDKINYILSQLENSKKPQLEKIHNLKKQYDEINNILNS